MGCSAADAQSTDDTTTLSAKAAQALHLEGNPVVGALLFEHEFPATHGNGRTCATCHVPEEGFQLTPANVERRWQALQAAKQQNPNADDPLFRSIDADDKNQDFTLLRKHALVRVVIDLPRDAQGNKLVWPVDDPNADSVELYRATPTVMDVSLDAPYQYDGRFPTLQAQANGALHGHAKVQDEPNPRFLDDMAAFEKTVYSSDRTLALAIALDNNLPLPNTAPPNLSEFEQKGKQIFDIQCAICHGGPRGTSVHPAIANIPGVLDIQLSKPVAPFETDLPWAPSPVIDKMRLWAVRIPGQAEPMVRPSTDPGKVLITGNAVDFNSFEVPPLYGVAKTAPYFRDNSAATLRDVIRHYQLAGQGLQRVIPEGVPWPIRPVSILDEDFDPLIAYLEKL